MKCPMKFNNPACDVDESCELDKCMWFVAVDGVVGCAIALSAKPARGTLTVPIIPEREARND